MIFTGIVKENNSQGLEDYSLVYFFPVCLAKVDRPEWMLTLSKKKKSLKNPNDVKFIVFNHINVASLTAKELCESVDLTTVGSNGNKTLEYNKNIYMEGEKLYREKYKTL